MRIPRLTVGRLMVAVAVVAVSIWIGMLAADRRAFLAEAAYHDGREREEIANLSALSEARARGDDLFRGSAGPKLEAASRLRVAYHAEWKRIYESAAARPWKRPTSPPEEPGSALIWEAFIPDAIEDDLPRILPLDEVPGGP